MHRLKGVVLEVSSIPSSQMDLMGVVSSLPHRIFFIAADMRNKPKSFPKLVSWTKSLAKEGNAHDMRWKANPGETGREAPSFLVTQPLHNTRAVRGSPFHHPRLHRRTEPAPSETVPIFLNL